MDLTKVKLVVSDMDGTLLNDSGVVSPRFFELFEKLKENDIQFIAASGRQYFSIIDKLRPISNDITVIAENGGYVVKEEQELHTCCLDTETTKDLIATMRKINDAHIVLCGKKKAYVEDKDSRFLNIFNEYYARYELVDDLMEIGDDVFFKIAVYSFGGSETTTYPKVKHLEDQIKVKVSGENWLDLSHKDADKGRALNMLQEKLGISREETLVFGDYNNDLEMLALADFSYGMRNSHPAVLKAVKFTTGSNNDFGVENVLQQLIFAREQSDSKSS